MEVELGMGGLLRKLREERGISKKWLVQGRISEKTLYNFESGKTSLRFDDLLVILNRLNFSLEDFVTLLEEENKVYEGEKLNSVYQGNFYIMLQKSSREELDELRLHYKELYKETHNFYYRYSELLVKGHIRDRFYGRAMSKRERSDVQDYLFSVEHWGFFEYRVFVNLSSYLEDSFVDIMHEKILDCIQKNEKSYTEGMFIFYVRYIWHLLEEENVERANFYTQEFEKSMEGFPKHNFRLMIYLECYKAFLDAIESQNWAEVTKKILFFYEFHDESYFESFSKLINKYKK